MDPTKFSMLAEEFGDISMLVRKGVFPYDEMVDSSFFLRRELPSKDRFFNKLQNKHISDEYYSHAHLIWENFGMKTLGEYHDLYLKCDVLMLADIFENFRSVCLQNYGLDPAHYLTLPAFSFDAMYKTTEVQLDVITDPDIYAFLESGIRGGISVVSHHYAKANNPYITDYDCSKPNSYIIYMDMVNLYGSAMKNFLLPTDSFKVLTAKELKEIDFLAISEDSPKGYILSVDLEYKPEFHTQQNDYPLAPERLCIEDSELSNYSKKLKQKLGGSRPVPKLIPNLRSKTHYILDYRLLQLYCKLGMVLKCVHKGIKFNQSSWLASFIDINTKLRAAATSKFEKDLFKKISNSTYGKTMENVRSYKEIKLATNERQYNKLISSPRCKQFSIFTSDLVGISMLRKSTCLNKPIYVGLVVLEMSKLQMFRFHYDMIVARYQSKAKLLFTDTDSFIYHIQTDDIYHDMVEQKDLYDTSEYPEDHFLFSTENRKVLGKMKDETSGSPISEFIALRAKMYAYKEGTKEIKKAKGIKRQVVREDIQFADYYDALFHETVFKHQMKLIQATKHQIYSVIQTKKSLSPSDDKRYILDDGITTLAHGHYSIIAGEEANSEVDQ